MRISRIARALRSRRALARGAAIACAAVAFALPATAQPPRSEPTRPDWQRPERWAQLRVGMTPFEVLRLLGEPGKVTRYYAFERWEYPDALGRRLNFDERGRLSLWGPLAR